MKKSNLFVGLLMSVVMLTTMRELKQSQLAAKATAAAADYWGWSNTTSYLVGAVAVYGGAVAGGAIGTYFGGPAGTVWGARIGGFLGGL